MIRFASPGYIAAGGNLVRALLGFCHGVLQGLIKHFGFNIGAPNNCQYYSEAPYYNYRIMGPQTLFKFLRPVFLRLLVAVVRASSLGFKASSLGLSRVSGLRVGLGFRVRV